MLVFTNKLQIYFESLADFICFLRLKSHVWLLYLSLNEVSAAPRFFSCSSLMLLVTLTL